MRLLNVHTLEFSDYSEDVPKYAVASHRWKARTEATIKDVRNKRKTDKDGYRKVEGFAKYVREHVCHVEWLWIDTCCVNQDSSQEVTEAVNSMFRWYSNAEVCLAYLADVSNAENEREFRVSEWFYRGWTLQELLVPQVVVFLSASWDLIGHRGGDGWTRSGNRVASGRALEATISTITGIPESVLHDYTRSMSFGTEERLSWISGRKTTREEDMSYSLLGIFNVNMPVIYGEGAKKARERLMEEIRKHTISTHAYSSHQTTSSNVPLLGTLWCSNSIEAELIEALLDIQSLALSSPFGVIQIIFLGPSLSISSTRSFLCPKLEWP
jgi:ankyrin repeat domain-containing protein 50